MWSAVLFTIVWAFPLPLYCSKTKWVKKERKEKQKNTQLVCLAHLLMARSTVGWLGTFACCSSLGNGCERERHLSHTVDWFLVDFVSLLTTLIGPIMKFIRGRGMELYGSQVDLCPHSLVIWTICTLDPAIKELFLFWSQYPSNSKFKHFFHIVT